MYRAYLWRVEELLKWSTFASASDAELWIQGHMLGDESIIFAEATGPYGYHVRFK